jgi:hypothetical protein
VETARSSRPSKTPLFVAFLFGTVAGYVMDFHRSKHDSEFEAGKTVLDFLRLVVVEIWLHHLVVKLLVSVLIG